MKTNLQNYNEIHNKIFEKLPNEIIENIFLYDNIYRENYEKIIKTLNCCLVKYEDSIYEINRKFNVKNNRFDTYSKELFYFLKLFYDKVLGNNLF